MSPIAVALFVAAVVLVVAAEWPRLGSRFAPKLGAPARKRRSREKRKAKLHVVPDHEEFARAVERDLASLPTTDEQDAKRRR